MTEFLWPYLSLAFSAFISATLLPFGSELVLVGLVSQGYPVLMLWGIATVFNTLGSVLNWYLGRQLLLFQHKSWFMFKPKQIEQAIGIALVVAVYAIYLASTYLVARSAVVSGAGKKLLA